MSCRCFLWIIGRLSFEELVIKAWLFDWLLNDWLLLWNSNRLLECLMLIHLLLWLCCDLGLGLTEGLGRLLLLIELSLGQGCFRSLREWILSSVSEGILIGVMCIHFDRIALLLQVFLFIFGCGDHRG